MAQQPSTGTSRTVSMSEFNARAKRVVAQKAEPTRHERQVFARSSRGGAPAAGSGHARLAKE